MNKLFFENILPGTVLFKRFRLLRCISSNDEGGVYLCEQIDRANARVALKILMGSAARDPHAVERLHRELAISRLVSHPNIIRVHEPLEDSDFAAFAMDYIEGTSLGEYISTQFEHSVEFTIQILSQLCDGLSAIHNVGVIHRDIKPENLLVTPGRTLKIIDFGIASAESDARSQHTQCISGTLDYLSPEYIQHGHVSPQADIYSVGVIAYQLLTQRLPFAGSSLLDVLTQRVWSDPIPPNQLRDGIPRALNDITLRALERSPEERYHSADEMLVDLRGFVLRQALALA